MIRFDVKATLPYHFCVVFHRLSAWSASIVSIVQLKLIVYLTFTRVFNPFCKGDKTYLWAGVGFGECGWAISDARRRLIGRPAFYGGVGKAVIGQIIRHVITTRRWMIAMVVIIVIVVVVNAIARYCVGDWG